MKKKKEESLSSSESPLSFLSLPHDIVFNTLARIPRTSYPNLSLVSKSFRSLLSSLASRPHDHSSEDPRSTSTSA
ncbi:hypothetical protein Bca52824_083148 [Brassica carinata]|uniref:F-box domain-containing protein n=1 Tax=Brassica carinata TaxID=52824 RepID=A0A8X7PL66_BRACI|nr:hypothetical protein Bca52824_083148 [Brassica carinata]